MLKAEPCTVRGWDTSNVPLFFAEHGTILNVYAKHLFTRGDGGGHLVTHPQRPLPQLSLAGRPRFVLADVTGEQFRAGWLSRIYQARIRWPHTPIGVIVGAGGTVVDEAEAYTAGANVVFSNLDPMEQVYADLDKVGVRMTLPERKAQILMGYSVGRDQNTLAGELFIGTETVKSHTSDMFHQLGARSKPMLVHQAFAGGLFEYGDAAPGDLFPLTPMEAVTALTIGRAGSQQAAAEILGRSAFTLKSHTQNVRRRVGWSISESIAAVWRWGQYERFGEHVAPLR